VLLVQRIDPERVEITVISASTELRSVDYELYNSGKVYTVYFGGDRLELLVNGKPRVIGITSLNE